MDIWLKGLSQETRDRGRDHGSSPLPLQSTVLLLPLSQEVLEQKIFCLSFQGTLSQAVFRIRIHRIHVLFGHPDPDPLVRGMIRIRLWIRIRILLSSCKNNKKNLESYYFVTLFDFLSLKNNVNVPSKCNMQKKLC
jgi:hypothetical protein